MEQKSKNRECPFCKEEIKTDAIKCKHCHSKLNLITDNPDHEGTCPFCKEAIKPDAIKCRYCLSNLIPNAVEEPCGCKEASHSSNYQQMRRRPLMPGAVDEVCSSTGTLWCGDMFGNYHWCGSCIPSSPPGPWNPWNVASR